MKNTNHHPLAFVRVYVRGLHVEYTVRVARLKTATNGAFRRYPEATEVEVSRERWSTEGWPFAKVA